MALWLARCERTRWGGRYGYPSNRIMDQTVYVIYTIAKEDVALCRFPLQALADGRSG